MSRYAVNVEVEALPGQILVEPICDVEEAIRNAAPATLHANEDEIRLTFPVGHGTTFEVDWSLSTADAREIARTLVAAADLLEARGSE